MKRFFSFLIALSLFALILFVGIKSQDYIEVELNANIVCLSCMGIE